MAKKELRLEFTDYVVKGTALIKPWGTDELYTIEMKPFHIKSKKVKDIIPYINDHGFGCEKICEVDISIYENYEGYLIEDSSQIIKLPPNCGKRGI